MPLYLYECQTCELEMEELHPLGLAPARAIRCPICGGWFERVIANVHSRGSAHRANFSSMDTSPLQHGLNCICCRPRPGRN